MRIGIVLDPYAEGKPSGLGRYILDLSSALISAGSDHECIIYTKGGGAPPPLPAGNWSHVPLKGGKLWREIGLRRSKKADVYIFGTPMLPLTVRLPKAIVVAHDFPYKHIAPDSIKQWLLRPVLSVLHTLSLQRADAIVGNTTYSCQEVVNLFGIPAEKTHVIHNGFRNICAQSTPERVAAPEPFLLMVGAVKERKNTLRAIQAFHSLLKKIPHTLVVAGKTGNDYSKEVMEYISTHNLGARVIFIGHGNDGQLAYLYRSADALLFPSIIESFGFPVLEAQSCGLPVVTSSIGGVAEVAGTSAVLVDPYSIESIARGIEEVTNAGKREFLIKQGRENTARFSWESTAEQFLRLIDSLV
ncbi:hypothetical protein COU17_03365 [Candidatus Kaiserbacteria bacterium CG10_big_fil_rev_8_21_14_0_10_49_17]|uniref:Glycosyltransferase family 1 protein n=1 Tax=Candidatus Kaiserbacteria bacterium CG10_big_fil_rev_8_21_14_0_10_49_17 TaxID=1974609 RepID=A0A2M6WDZ6_9BACT|nr:MAG: hypothetical protein COU17_03365 [Candidatus Kaiserbacteria bacterium CG10_big_fil_rev_8_21_14_0_10_49_17]